jgi:HEPN domain-containing protein
MAVPSSSDARLFYRCAFQRFEEAQVLFKANYNTGAVYLAGYGIECMLKALVIMAVPAVTRNQVLRSFRTARAHDYAWLRDMYLIRGGAKFPSQIARAFTLVNEWSTEIRYSPTSVRTEEAEAFLNSASVIIKWADGRL